MSFYIMTPVAILIISFLLIGYKNTKSVVVNHIHIDQNTLHPKTSLHVLHISDMHLENISVTPKQLYETLKGERIDLIALTGDFLDKAKSIPKLEKYLTVLQKLQPTYGAYAVYGNHDYVLKEKHFSQLEQLLHKYNVKTMRNRHESIQVEGQVVNLIGIDDYGTKRGDLSTSYKNVQENGYHLVLTHDPNIVLDMKHYHFDYLLAGHFHGGQICWPEPYQLTKLGKMGKLPSMNIFKGLHYFQKRPYYISEGLGQTGVNIRIGSKPEVTLHQIQIPLLHQNKEIEVAKRVS